MEQRVCAGYVITQSIQVKDTEFVLGEHPKTGMCTTWQCKNGDNYFWGHYCTNKYDALKDLCERASQEVDYLASIGAIPPLASRKEKRQGVRTIMEAEMTMRPMFPVERNYSYVQSQQISMQTGLIGYLRADFGSNGEGFFSTWNDFRESLKSEEFKLEFDEVINELRKNGNLLHNRGTLTRCCHQTPDSSFRNDRNEYGFRADTDHYSYVMRLNPNKGEYNLYCYCYVKQWLDRHMRQAEKGIRFITPDYKELFRIADGDKIRYFTPGGEVREPVCRYIDDYHFETQSPGFGNLYHICEFAERYTERGCQGIIPLRSSLPEKCFSYLESTGEMIVITKGEKGYIPTGASGENMTPREAVDAANKTIGVTKAQEAAMVAGSMFGWQVPGADPKNYDDQGLPIRPKPKEREDAR